MHRFAGGPASVHTTRYIDVANLLRRTIAIGDDWSTRRHRRRILAAVARPLVEAYFGTELSVGTDRRRHEHHLVRGVMTSLGELAPVEPHGAERSRFAPHGDKAV